MSYRSTPDMALAEQMQPRQPVSAWLVSLALHALLFVAMGITWQALPRSGATENDRQVGIVLVHEQQGQREYFDPLGDATATDAAAQQTAIQDALASETDMPIDPAEFLPGPGAATDSSMAAAILDATNLTGEGNPRRGGDQQGTSTEVFGITGTGHKFVYVFDRSGSMDEYQSRPLRAAKLELTRSLEDLTKLNQFQIIFYNEKPRIFQLQPGRPELVWGDEQGKSAAAQFVQAISASGGTRHLEALKLALGMYPDVIFFLTDADEPQLTAGELQRIRTWNRGTQIHAIEFGYGAPPASDNFLKRLARQNRGQHAYVDITRLQGTP